MRLQLCSWVQGGMHRCCSIGTIDWPDPGVLVNQSYQTSEKLKDDEGWRCRYKMPQSISLNKIRLINLYQYIFCNSISGVGDFL